MNGFLIRMLIVVVSVILMGLGAEFWNFQDMVIILLAILIAEDLYPHD